MLLFLFLLFFHVLGFWASLAGDWGLMSAPDDPPALQTRGLTRGGAFMGKVCPGGRQLMARAMETLEVPCVFVGKQCGPGIQRMSQKFQGRCLSFT